QSPAPPGNAAAAARRRGRLRSAAGDQADQDAVAAHSRRLRPHAARRALRAVHLFGGFALAAAAWRLLGGSLRTHLDEPAAGARVGLSEIGRRRTDDKRQIGYAASPSSVLRRPTMASPK